MGILFKSKKGGMADVIRCDEPSYLIWKWRPQGSQKTDGRANAIRWGSSLRVKDGEVAVFVYSQDDGTKLDFIEGPFDQQIKTANFPVLSQLIGLAYNQDSPFQAEVYFINLARIIQTKFGIPYFDVFDPRFDDFGVPVAVRGTASFQIADYRSFIKLHKLSEFDVSSFENQVRDAIVRYVKDVVANAPAAHDIPVIQIETKIGEINDRIEYNISERLKEDFGVIVSGIDIGSIEVDKTSEGYNKLMAVTKEVTTATVEAETAAHIKNIQDKQRIEAMNYEETLRIQREEAQYAQHMKTQTANISAVQIEAQKAVGMAGAEALGHMGENSAGSVDLGNGGSGFNPAAMMAGMALGGAVGQNLAGVMNTAMQPGAVPPPVKSVGYHVVINGQATGPFDIQTLKQMVESNQLIGDSLVWKSGMPDWIKASDSEELKGLLKEDMPPIPTDK